MAFAATTLAGEKLSFPADFKGKLVMLDFWATWCKPCLEEMPHVAKAYDQFRSQGFEVVGVSLDTLSAGKVEPVVRNHKMVWPQVLKTGSEIASSYGVAAIPAAFLINGDDGRVLAQGDELRGDALAKTIEKHLAELKR